MLCFVSSFVYLIVFLLYKAAGLLACMYTRSFLLCRVFGASSSSAAAAAAHLVGFGVSLVIRFPLHLSKHATQSYYSSLSHIYKGSYSTTHRSMYNLQSRLSFPFLPSNPPLPSFHLPIHRIHLFFLPSYQVSKIPQAP